MLNIILFICVLCLVYVWWQNVRAPHSRHALPPALSGKLPIFGHVLTGLSLTEPDLMLLLKKVTADNANQGGVTHIKLFSELYYLITDPQDTLTAVHSCLQRHYAFSFSKPWLGDGLLTSSGETWKLHRKLLNPAFTLPVVHGFLDVFNSQSKKLVSAMEPLVGKGLFDHRLYLRHNAMETLLAGMLGLNVTYDTKFTQKYMESVDAFLSLVITRTIQFWLQNDFVYKLFGLKKKEEELVETLNTMSDKVLQQKMATMKDKVLSNNSEYENLGSPKHKTFLDLLLELSANGALTDRDIREEMNTIIVSGFETTSNQLTITLLLLGAHPEVQEKVYEELLEVLGADRDVEKDDVNKLIYTNAVIMESIRLFPSVPFLLRNVDKDVKLKNYTMRAGSYCAILPLYNHLDTSWGPESDQFRPERWLSDDIRKNKEFGTFGLGKRACIGKTYAMTTMKVVLAHFLRRYRVNADMSKLQLSCLFVMKPVSGHEISIERRM